MDNRETLIPSSGDAILKRHPFSEVARNWIKGRGHIGRRISCADQVDRVSDSEWPLRAAQFLKPPALPGDIYSSEMARTGTSRRCRIRQMMLPMSPRH